MRQLALISLYRSLRAACAVLAVVVTFGAVPTQAADNAPAATTVAQAREKKTR